MTVKLDTTKLDQILRESPGKLANVVGQTATRILEQAKMITPRDPNRPPENPDAYKPSGALRGKTDVTIEDLIGLTQHVNYYQEYAVYQELGFVASNGRLVGPRPFLTPAVEKEEKKFIAEITKVVNQ